MKKLISMVDYCQEVSKEFMMPKKPFDKNEWFGKILNYSDFLKQPLNLSIFVPCKLFDGIWVVLECPHNYGLLHTYPTGHKLMDESFKDALEYQEAKDRVLFEGFEYHKESVVSIMHKHGWGIIERDLYRLKVEEYANDRYNLELTQTAQKQLS